jgi:RES domain
VQYFSDTADGAWAEFLRHEEITEPDDVATVRRALWAVELPDDGFENTELPLEVLTGGPETYPACREEGRRIRARGVLGILAPSASLLPGEARGWRVDGGLTPGPDRDGQTIAIFGRRPDLIGWAATGEGRPREDLLPAVRHLQG